MSLALSSPLATLFNPPARWDVDLRGWATCTFRRFGDLLKSLLIVFFFLSLFVWFVLMRRV